MLINGVNFPMDQIAEICLRYGAAKLSLFGSILAVPTHEGGYGFRPSSDVDILVEFHPESRIGLIGIATMEADLSDAIGRAVDLRTAGDLSRYFRDEVVRQARLLHAA
ncbi:MAG: nucleotidyltransferase [Phycisphaerales bacterium]|nr:nucleotidyltransferase [Phycisphaerales bacterium]